jgi:hypothetical protein
LARAEVVQEGGVRIAYEAKLGPVDLPRVGTAPATLRFGTRLTPLGSDLPQLRRVSLAFTRHGFLDTRGVPVCQLRQVQPASNETALRECRDSLIGEGRFRARVLIPEQPPFPSRGRVLAFYGRDRGRPAILAHVYGTDPAPVSYTIPFRMRRTGGTFGTVLTAALAPSLGRTGYITLLRLTLGGRFGHLRARCPAPAGATGALYPLASLSIGFPHQRLQTKLLRSCRVRA